MKTSLFAILLFGSSFVVNWENNLTLAKQKAVTEHKFILLNFSGSDWCGPCIRMHKEIFDTPDFEAFAQQQLILIRADFPRQKKNQLSKSAQENNNSLAEKYNPNGIFPFTALLNANGDVIKVWEGLPKMNSTSFISELKQTINTAK
ncbi:MAG: thioredoxin family protein [Sphingobacteriia bacterium]|jgi:thioredoxin-related protein